MVLIDKVDKPEEGGTPYYVFQHENKYYFIEQGEIEVDEIIRSNPDDLVTGVKFVASIDFEGYDQR